MRESTEQYAQNTQGGYLRFEPNYAFPLRLNTGQPQIALELNEMKRQHQSHDDLKNLFEQAPELLIPQ